MTLHDHRLLAGVHPTLVAAVEKILAAMDAGGNPMMVCYGVRTVEEQQRLYTQGRSKPGHIVTNADGVTHKSNHQLKDDGYGHAVDCCFVLGGLPSWDLYLPWKLYGSTATSEGLSWGGNWKHLHDLPHIELP